ncbi:MAG: hypothetical protein QM736_04980 [Vicinamibacterales bacterium]
MVLSLPWLALTLPPLTPALESQMHRALAKFARMQGDIPLRLTVEMSCDVHGDADAARAIAAQANVSFQFVTGVEETGDAQYATGDGSVVHVDFAGGRVSFTLNEAVFDAPYSTWADLVAAPLAATWRHHGCFPLHAAAVSFDDGGAVLVVGASGSGKTTTALALAKAGALWRADDKVLLRRDGGRIAATSLYANTNLAPATIAAHDDLSFVMARPPLNDTNDKRACQLDELGQRVDLSPFTPSALVFPRQVDRTVSSLRRLDTMDVVVRLAAQSPTSGERTVLRRQHEQIVALATSTPAWEVEAGRDILTDPAAFARTCRAALLESPLSTLA